MGFSLEIRTQALVAAARHCCVCHRYKGVKVEVHHIVAQAQGGSDDFDNAITLCFDCHTDAGHYNPNHPRGTKFSRKELREHRDTWHKIVQEHRIQSPEGTDLLYCRYLICRNFEAFREISVGNFQNIPIPECMLLQNKVLRFQQELISNHSHTYRHTEQHGRSYLTMEEFFEAHPHAERLDESGPHYPYFNATRLPSETEVKDHVCPLDSVARLLVDNNVPISEIAKAFAYKMECSGDHIEEIYRLRPLWAAYLAVTNVTQKQVILSGLEGAFETDQGYQLFKRPDCAELQFLPLPSAPILPKSTVIIPIATLLGPFDYFEYPQWSFEIKSVSTGQTQEFVHTSFEQTNLHVNTIGPVIWPSKIQLTFECQSQLQEIHDLDLTNLYLINRSWECGCCPYLFFRNSQTGRVLYGQELFSKMPGTKCSHSIFVPKFADEILIAELEDEETYINEILENGSIISKSKRLRKGDVLRFSINPGAILHIGGSYIPNENVVIQVRNPWRKNELITNFLIEASSML